MTAPRLTLLARGTIRLVGEKYPYHSLLACHERALSFSKGESNGGGEALNPSLIASIGPSLTFTIQGTVLAA